MAFSPGPGFTPLGPSNKLLGSRSTSSLRRRMEVARAFISASRRSSSGSVSWLRRLTPLPARSTARPAVALARPASEISALEVVQTLDGEISEQQLLIAPWGEVVGALRQQLAERDLATLAAAETAESGGAMYYI